MDQYPNTSLNTAKDLLSQASHLEEKPEALIAQINAYLLITDCKLKLFQFVDDIIADELNDKVNDLLGRLKNYPEYQSIAQIYESRWFLNRGIAYTRAKQHDYYFANRNFIDSKNALGDLSISDVPYHSMIEETRKLIFYRTMIKLTDEQGPPMVFDPTKRESVTVKFTFNYNYKPDSQVPTKISPSEFSLGFRIQNKANKSIVAWGLMPGLGDGVSLQDFSWDGRNFNTSGLAVPGLYQFQICCFRSSWYEKVKDAIKDSEKIKQYVLAENGVDVGSNFKLIEFVKGVDSGSNAQIITHLTPTLPYAQVGHWGKDNKEFIFPENGVPAPPAMTPWEHSLSGFDEYILNPMNKAAPDNFIDRDPDRFYLRVYDYEAFTNHSDKIIVQIGTKKPDGSIDDEFHSITLKKSASDNSMFVSQSQLLVSQDLQNYDAELIFETDDSFKVFNNYSTSKPDQFVADEELDDRTHKATLNGKVSVRYGVQESHISICPPEAPDGLRVIKVRFFVFYEPPETDVNGDGSINGIDEEKWTILGSTIEARDYILKTIERTNSAMEQCGIQIEWVNCEDFLESGYNFNVFSEKVFFIHDDFFCINAGQDNGGNNYQSDFIALALKFKDRLQTRELNVFFVPRIIVDPEETPFISVTYGFTCNPHYFKKNNQINVEMEGKTLAFLTIPVKEKSRIDAKFSQRCLAHELGHSLDNIFIKPFGPDVYQGYPHIFYPGRWVDDSGYNDLVLKFGDSTPNYFRRITHSFEKIMRLSRPDSDYEKCGNILLSTPRGGQQ